MKNLFRKLFGGRDTIRPAEALTPKHKASTESLRQLIEASENADERAGREREMGVSLGQQGIDPSTSDSPAVWIHAICAAKDSIRAAAWLDRIKAEAELEQIATTARLAEIRLMAARRITAIERIGRLAEHMRDKDRGLYRHCQSLLKEHAERTRRAERIEHLRQQLRSLMAAEVPPGGRLYELRKLFAQLDDGPDLAECRTLLQQAGQREQDEAARLHVLEDWVKEARALLATLKKAEAIEPREREQAQALATRLGALPAALTTRKEVSELATLVRQMEVRLTALDEDALRTQACRQFLADIAGQAPTAAIEAAWQALPKPENARDREALQAEWQARSAPAAEQPARPVPQPKRALADVSGFNERLEQLELAIEQGASQTAFRLSRELDQITAESVPPPALANRHRQLVARLGKLRDWARWSSAQARDKLIEEAEALLTAPSSLPHVAETVPRLREEWKRLDGFSRASKEQWQRFDQALNQAYQPVLAERDERNARQDAISSAKSSLLDEAAAWLAGLDRETLNPGVLQRRRHALRQSWRGLPQAGPRDERRLQIRFHALMDQLDAIIQPFLAAETERRTRLTGVAKRLETEANLREAVLQAKTLLQRWRGESNGVRLPRQLDEQQWHAFREAVDTVFARRDAERKSHDTRHHEETAARQALLDEFRQTLEARPGLARIEAAITTFQEQWSGPEEEAGERERKRHRDTLDHQADALVDRARAMIREQQASRQREILTLIGNKAAWAEELESAYVAGEDTDATAQRLQEAWRNAPHLPADIEQKLAERFHRAQSVTAGDLEAGLLVRGNLLIDLEILLDLPTPAEFTGARQQRQLEWLQQGFQSLRQPAAMLAKVATWYGTAAPADSGQTARMNRVNEALAERLVGDEGK